MNINKRLGKSLFKECLRSPIKYQVARIYNRDRIGNRDWVAFGNNGRACYEDSCVWPFPPIRFKENTNDLLALREKEKGDWRKLSIEEKKTLYRASFRQTFAEVDAPTGEWKHITAVVLVCVSLGLWLNFYFKAFIHNPLPESFSEEYRKKTLRALLDLKVGIISGVSSKWDYEKDTWK